MLRPKPLCGVAAVLVVTASWLTALGAATPLKSPPNFDVVSSGPVGYYVDPSMCPGGSVITATAPASGTHFGGTGTLTAHECAQPDFTTGINHIDGEGVLTATDGAQIFYHYGGTSPLPDFATGALSEELVFSITGGTGRFAGASGGGRLRTHGNFYVSVTGEFEGTLTLRS
jgi:hypothetical protein